MKINRTEFLGKLEMIKAGLSPREFVEQGTCVVFQEGFAMTFNDEIACRIPIGGKLHGAVTATLLIQILAKIPDDDLEIEETDKEFQFKGKSKRFGILRDSEIFLRIDQVETPEKWKPLPEEVVESIKLVRHCVSGDESKFLLTCIHLHSDYVEACDNHQVMRCLVPTGLKDPILVRGSSLVSIVDLQLDSIALTEHWIHFRNKASGLILSIRRYDEDYPDLGKQLNAKGHPVTLPKSIGEVCDRAEVFSNHQAGGDPLVEVSLSNGVIRLSGRGAGGWYKEIKKAKYDGPPIVFTIAPKLLKYITTTGENFLLSQDRLKVTGGAERWEYVTALGSVNGDSVQS